MPLTKEQFAELYNQGLSVEQISAFESGKKPQDMGGSLPKDNFVSGLVKDPLKTLIVRPALRFGQTLGVGVAYGLNKAGLITQDQLDRAIDSTQKDVRVPIGTGGGGINVEGIKTGSEGAKQIVGESAETASYLLPGQRGISAVANLSKGRIVSSLLSGSYAGAVGGAFQGFGTGIQKDDADAGSVTYDTLVGAGIGGVTGAALGTGGALIGKGRNVYKTTQDVDKVTDLLTEKNREILNLPQRSKNLEARTGKDAAGFIARELPDARFKLDSNGRLDTAEVVDQLSTKYNAEEMAFESILESSGKYQNLNQIERDAIAQARRRFKGTAQDNAVKKIQDEFTAYRKQYSQYAAQDAKGEYILPSDRTNEIKRDLWSKTNFDAEPSKILRDTNFLAGDAVKDAIEKSIDDVRVKGMNKRLGDFAHAIRVLRARNGGVVPGGRLGRYFARVIGGTVGGVTGGIPGTLAGTVTADKLVQLLMNPSVKTFAIRRLLNKLPQAERQTIIQEAQRIMEQNAELFRNTKALPAPRYIEMAPPKPKPTEIKVLEAERISKKNPKTGKFERGYTSRPRKTKN